MNKTIKKISLALILTTSANVFYPTLKTYASTTSTIKKEVVEEPCKKKDIKKLKTCYPAYKCMSRKSIPKNYTFFFENKDRSTGIYMGSALIGALGFFGGTVGSVISYLTGLGIGYNELHNGYLSYRVYIKRNNSPGKKATLKYVYYKYPYFNGPSMTKYDSF